jgi:hypothetical protein
MATGSRVQTTSDTHFKFEDMLVELLLQLFVRVVDAKLFETVHFEGFKPAKILSYLSKRIGSFIRGNAVI